MINIEQTHTNQLLSKKEFAKLANIHDQHCISIYIPTSRTGDDIQQGQIILKNSLKDLKVLLREYHLNEPEIEDYLAPASNLVDDNHFWKNQSDCLVIFLNKQQMKYYTLPLNQDTFTYVSDHFYMMPILSLFSGDGKFYVLSLSLQDVKLYEGTRYSITEVFVEDLVPEKLEEVVGYDYRNKSLQFRSGQGSKDVAMFHGQGSGKDDKQMEIKKFMRAVDKGLMKLIKDENAPLILACVDHYQPIYASITDYPKLFGQNIGGNHEETDPLILHEMAWRIVKDYFQQDQKKLTQQLRDLTSNGKTSFDLNDIIPASIDGRIEVLFVQNAKDKYGLYDKVNRSLIIDEDIKTSQASLYNIAALQTWIKGGQVYLVEKDEMPLKGTSINAIFRY